MPMSTSSQPTGPTLSLAERDRRWALARTFMDEQGLDALLVFGEHEDAGPAPMCMDTWFTNDRPGMVVILPRDGDPTVLVAIGTFVLDHSEAVRRGESSWITGDQFLMGGHSASIAAALESRKLDKASIGVIGLDPYLPAHSEGLVPYRRWQNLLECLPKADFRPVGLAFARLMMPLSAEELALVRHSASIGDGMAQAMLEAARPGASEAEVYAAGMAVAHRSGTSAPGMHLWTGPAPAASGPPRWTYRAQAPRVLSDGDFLHSEVFCNYGMCQTQHQVAIAIGDVHGTLLRAGDVASRCYEAGLDAVRPGVCFADLAEAMLAPVELAGGWVRGPQVHGLNPFGAFARIPPGRPAIEGAEQYPDFAGMGTTLGDMKLEPGMTFAFEPSCGFARHLVTVGGTVVVGEDGAEELNPYTARILSAHP
jgi:Xaa-Pro aminopeptidase